MHMAFITPVPVLAIVEQQRAPRNTYLLALGAVYALVLCVPVLLERLLAAVAEAVGADGAFIAAFGEPPVDVSRAGEEELHFAGGASGFVVTLAFGACHLVGRTVGSWMSADGCACDRLSLSNSSYSCGSKCKTKAAIWRNWGVKRCLGRQSHCVGQRE